MRKPAFGGFSHPHEGESQLVVRIMRTTMHSVTEKT